MLNVNALKNNDKFFLIGLKKTITQSKNMKNITYKYRAVLTKPALNLLSAVFFDGISIGIIITLIPLILSNRGVSSDLIGLIYASVALSIILFISRASLISKRFGHVASINASGIILIIVSALYYVWQDPYFWLGLRIFSGIFVAIRWLGLEVWVNIIADDQHRGKLFAMYAGVFSLSVALGSAIATPIYDMGFLPFALMMLTLAISLYFVFNLRHISPKFDDHKVYFWRNVMQHKGIFIAALSSGILYGLSSMLALQAKMRGFNDIQAGYHISVFLIGPALFAWQIGSLIDKYPKRYLIAFCGLIIVIFAVPAMVVEDIAPSLFLTFILGFMDFMIYSACMAMLGGRYKGDQLLAMNTTYIIIFEVAVFSGAPVAGYLMEKYGIYGMPVMLSILGITALCVLMEKPLQRKEKP